jgi:hypothetical protein
MGVPPGGGADRPSRLIASGADALRFALDRVGADPCER